jgi:predicted O-linked N-acetylglucosamine transferase (SPINDLY family)
MLPYEDYLTLLYLSDVLLDTIHFNGGATTFDGLSVGTPIVTLPGESMRGRQTYSLYKRMGLMDCVAETAMEYVQVAVRLGTDPCYRENLRGEILKRNALIFEDVAMVRELEARLIEAVEAWPERSPNLTSG